VGSTERAANEYIVEANANSAACFIQVGTRYSPSACGPAAHIRNGDWAGIAATYIYVSAA
jgi:hypothetical protein